MDETAFADYFAAGFASFCLLTFIVIIVLIILAYLKKKKNFVLFEKKVLQNSEQADLYLSKLRFFGLKIGISVVVLMFVILFAVLFSLSFIYDFISEYIWIVFFIFILYYIAHMFYDVYRLNRLDDLELKEYKFIYDFAEEICQRYNLKMPKLKLYPDSSINAFTTTFFGRKTIIAIHAGILELYHKGRYSEKQIQAIVGHEFGHIINNDVIIGTLLRPLVNFVKAIKFSIKWIILTIIRSIKIVVGSAWNSGSIIFVLIAIGIALGLLVVLLFVGIYFVVFWFLAISVDFFFNLYDRQTEYSSDLFGAIVIHSPIIMATALMNLTRENGLIELKQKIAIDIIKKNYSEGRISFVQLYNPSYFRSITNSINIHSAVIENPNLIDRITTAEARYLLKKRKLEKFDERDCKEYSGLKIGLMEHLKGLKNDHPPGTKRVKLLSFFQ